MWSTTVAKRSRRYLAVLTALAIIAVLVFGSGLHSRGNWLRISDDADGTTRNAIGGNRGPDITSLNLDREGADMEEGSSWGASDDGGDATGDAIGGDRGPDITSLKLDRYGADIIDD